ncbi:galactan export ABC transporter permease subunit Wzm/RfbD [Rhodococcus chondri]|uniref:ABC transporter permease n=1 Tax=Rhodococcus chondri TaxID=3065941 RepID=A0ABU7JMS2_9NOCA|nr:ABC transporter permease [Rhodococcus sp. CC-R104]MEE2031164.1 ABC transporter permease [Rhodococcus sp. CC-R104]
MSAPSLDDELLESSSRTFRRAFHDLRDGFGHRELWLLLGWQDIKQRYRRSVLGPFWITIATGVSAIAMGVLYGTLFNLDVPTFLPYVALGFIIWNLISGSILEGADVFMSNEGLIKQLPTPLSVHVYRLVWRQMILFAHNIVIYVGILIVFPRTLHWTALAAIPALFLIAINAVWVSLVFGILATRYRDIAPLLGSIVQLLFFMTPIIWTEETLAGTGNESRARIAEINPLYHFLDIVRTPLLGGDQQLYHWIIVLVITVLGWGLALLAMRNYRSRVAYWV